MIKFSFPTFSFIFLLCNFLHANDRIPFYEEFIESGDFGGYLKLAHQFLDENPEAKESPRLALDLMMMGKAAEDLKSIVRGTDLLLFQYLGSLPSLHFISSFDKGSNRLTQLLKVKLNEADLSDQNFSNSYADTIMLLARIHGPELMHDPSLLLSSYLVVQQTDKEELKKSLSNALDVAEEKNVKFSPLIKICRSTNSSMEKISKLHELSTQKTDFFIKFFTSRLSKEEKNSPAFLESMIDFSLFGVPPKPQLALSYLSSLPDESSVLPKFQVSTALAHLLSGNSESAVTVLKMVSDPTLEDPTPWQEVAQSLLDGTEFRGSRRALFLEELTKLYDRWQRETNAFLIEGYWNKEDRSNQFHFLIGVDKKSKQFEIHISQNEKTVFAYRINPNHCILFSSTGKNIKFKSEGAFPLPQMEIQRDAQGGSFNYSFNLNFARNFDDFVRQVSETMDIPYIATPKGREVLLNHFFERKGMWLEPPASSEKGTVFNLKRIDPVSISQNYKVEISASGELVALNLGKLKITRFIQGETEDFASLLAWPEDLPPSQEQDFQLPVLLESVGQLMQLASSPK